MIIISDNSALSAPAEINLMSLMRNAGVASPLPPDCPRRVCSPSSQMPRTKDWWTLRRWWEGWRRWASTCRNPSSPR